ncbi:MAG: glutamyl-tRNA reductase [Xanthomonadales bacterium]|nr:Glutamyl-tRNA reductase [Xanthomonadales bacterium]MCC6593970.1 glutamyl-tRNA reductase [Xanthomonadales bacterium]MCE7931837.1 glutamyl-tRNA reductase [Xanthomonadales bacterium PRO6]
MAILALGINHTSAPVALRERVAFAPERTPQALRDLRALPGVDAAAILSTCNRTELYVDHAPGADRDAFDWLQRFHGLRATELEAASYRYQDAQAVRHVFRVATGLDSLVVGEPQILGQLKRAYRLAQDARTLSGPLEQLLQRSFAVAKTVRTETRLGASAVSLAYAAVRLAGQVFDELPKRQALLVGAGETIELVARHLHGAGVRRLLVVNRTLERAQALADRVGGQAARLSELNPLLADCDILVAAAGGNDPVVRSEAVRRAFAGRRRRPLFAVDLGVPRNIESGVGALDDVYLYTVDDLRNVVEEGLRGRREAAVQAESMVSLHVEEFMTWWRERSSTNAIVAMRGRAEKARDQVLERALRRIRHGESPEQTLAFLAHTLTNRLLHRPTVGLRSAAALGDEEFVELASRLLALEVVEKR